MWLINQRATQVLMGPVLNALLYLWVTKQFKANLPYYNASDIKTIIKAGSIYFLSEIGED